jgi:hypothetical protein
MEIWPLLVSSENGDALVIHSMIGKDIYSQIKTQTLTIPRQ